MTRAAIEAPAPAPVADGIWRPKFLEERQAFICHRFFRAGDRGTEVWEQTIGETYGARLQAPEGSRFSALYIFGEADAQAQCDRLNNGD